MHPDANSFSRYLDEVVQPLATDTERVAAIIDVIGELNLGTQASLIGLAAQRGVILARRAGQPEMEAQFYLKHALAEIVQGVPLVDEMKILTMGVDWFEFALERERARYQACARELGRVWASAQELSNLAFKTVRAAPIAGVIAACHASRSAILQQYYFQLKLRDTILRSPWRARIANNKISRWLWLHDILLLTSEARIRLRVVRQDAIGSLRAALRLFKRAGERVFVVDTLLDIAGAHHGFDNALRSQYYLAVARLALVIDGTNEKARLKSRVQAIRDLPLVGSRSERNRRRAHEAAATE